MRDYFNFKIRRGRFAILSLQMDFGYKKDTIWLAWSRFETFIFWCGYLRDGCRNALESPRSNRRAFFASSTCKPRMRLGRSRFSLDHQATDFENTFFGRRRLNKSYSFPVRERCCMNAAVILHYYDRQTLETQLWPARNGTRANGPEGTIRSDSRVVYCCHCRRCPIT